MPSGGVHPTKAKMDSKAKIRSSDHNRSMLPIQKQVLAKSSEATTTTLTRSYIYWATYMKYR